jgi:hypothetical protein
LRPLELVNRAMLPNGLLFICHDSAPVTILGPEVEQEYSCTAENRHWKVWSIVGRVEQLSRAAMAATWSSKALRAMIRHCAVARSHALVDFEADEQVFALLQRTVRRIGNDRDSHVGRESASSF